MGLIKYQLMHGMHSRMHPDHIESNRELNRKRAETGMEPLYPVEELFVANDPARNVIGVEEGSAEHRMLEQDRTKFRRYERPTKEVQADLETLRQENQELLSRIKALEGQKPEMTDGGLQLRADAPGASRDEAIHDRDVPTDESDDEEE